MQIARNQNSAQQTIPTSQYDRKLIEELQMEMMVLREEKLNLIEFINNNNR
jgi:hypothetical protein